MTTYTNVTTSKKLKCYIRAKLYLYSKTKKIIIAQRLEHYTRKPALRISPLNWMGLQTGTISRPEFRKLAASINFQASSTAFEASD